MRSLALTSASLSFGLAATLLVSSCSGSVSPEGASPAQTLSTESSAELGAGGESAVQQFLSLEPSVPDLERWTQGQERVFACMADKGFDYVPVPYPAELESLVPLDDRSVEWVEEFGLGVTTRYYSNPVVAAHGLIGRDEIEADLDAPPTDPNDALLAELQPGERQAWEEALYGAAATDAPTEEQIEVGMIPIDGCQALTWYSSADQSSFYFENVSVFEEIEARIEADPRYVDHIEAIGVCVRNETGLDSQQFPDIEAYGSLLLNRLRESLANDYAERVLGEADAFGVDSREAFEEYVRSGQAVLNPDEAAILRELQAEELAVVEAHQEDCGGTETPILRTQLREELTPLVLEQYGF